MNITDILLCSVEVDSEQTVYASFSLRNASRTNPYILKSATGLDVEQIDRTYFDGPKFFRTIPSERFVSFLVKLNPDYKGGTTVGDLRDTLYKTISGNQEAETWNDESKIEIKFMNNGIYVASLFGFVTQVPVDLFSKDPTLTITIECPFPFIRSTEDLDFEIDNAATGSHVYNSVTYPISSRITIDDPNSNAPHGFKMEIEFTGGSSKLIIWDIRNPDIYLFWIVYSFNSGDKVYLSSEEDDVYIYRVRSGVTLSLHDKYLWGSIWPFMRPGLNVFETSEDTQINDATYKETYWGL